MTVADILKNLREVDGVYGSLVTNGDGNVVQRDYPNIVSNRAVSLAGQKLCRLWESLGDQQVQYINLNFKHHRIHIRRFDYGSIFIFIPPRINMLTLEGVTKIAIESLNRMSVEAFQKPLPNTHTRNPDQDLVIYRGIAHEIN